MVIKHLFLSLILSSCGLNCSDAETHLFIDKYQVIKLPLKYAQSLDLILQYDSEIRIYLVNSRITDLSKFNAWIRTKRNTYVENEMSRIKKERPKKMSRIKRRFV
jgi:hypothetical protein